MSRTKLFAKIWNKCALNENYWVWLGSRKTQRSLYVQKHNHNKFCEKILVIEGRNWNSQFFCTECKNELTFSNSFVEAKDTPNGGVVKYVCSFCSNTQYGNLDVIPGIMNCNEDGSSRMTVVSNGGSACS
jgi:hypothetical protein